MKTQTKMFLSRYDLFAKYLCADQMTYLEQMYTKNPLIRADIGY